MKHFIFVVVFIVADTELECISAILIQRIFRGVLGRLKYSKHQSIAINISQVYKKQILTLIEHRSTATIQIQTFVRQVMCKIRVERDYLRPKKAVLCISRFWRALAASRMVLEMKRKKELKLHAVDVIQRCWSGYKGRCQFWQEVRLHKVKEREQHLLNPTWVMRHDFERRGAMLRLQRWWKSKLANRNFAKNLIKNLHTLMAIKIQNGVRCYLYGTLLSKERLSQVYHQLDVHYDNTIGQKHQKKNKTNNKGGKKKTRGLHDWITCQHNKIKCWTSELIVNSMLQTSVGVYIKNLNIRIQLEILNKKANGEDTTDLKNTITTDKENQARTNLTKLKLKIWRRRADISMLIKQHRLDELSDPCEKRLMVYPFDSLNLRSCAQRNIYDLQNRTKQGLRCLIRALWTGNHPKMALMVQKYCQLYFCTKRSGNKGMQILMNREDLRTTERSLSDALFWQMLGTSAYAVWLETRRPITLATASLAFDNLLTFQEGANGLNLLQAARVSITKGDMNRALQLCATTVLEFPDAPSHVMSQVVFLSALVQHHLKMDTATIIEYMVSLIPLPPNGLTDDHILLQLARIHESIGNYTDSKAAGLEIYSTLKRRRKLPKGVHTFQQWYTSPEMWMSFAHDYTTHGYDLAALECSSESLRLATLIKQGRPTITMTRMNSTSAAEGKEQTTAAELQEKNHNPTLLTYVPKEGVTLQEAIQAAKLIQGRFRVRQGQLSLHLKKQAVASLSKELLLDVVYLQAMYNVGISLWRTGSVEKGRSTLHQTYLKCCVISQRLSLLNLLIKYSHSPHEEEAEVEAEGKDDDKEEKATVNTKTNKNKYSTSVLIGSTVSNEQLHESIYSIVSCQVLLATNLSRMKRVPSPSWCWYRSVTMSHSTFYAALSLQNLYRIYKSKQILYTLQLDAAAKTIQHLWLNRHEIRAFVRFRKKMRAIKIVQRAWRNRMSRMILNMIIQKREGKQRIYRALGERGIRAKRAVRRVSVLRDQTRRKAEQMKVGKMEYRRTVLFASDVLLMNGETDDLCELKTIFLEFTTNKDRNRSQSREGGDRKQSGRGTDKRSPSRSSSPSQPNSRSHSESSHSVGNIQEVAVKQQGTRSSKDLRVVDATMKSMGFKKFLTSTSILDQNLNMVACDIAFAKAAQLYSSSPAVLNYKSFVFVLILLAKEKWKHLFAKEEKKKKKKRSSVVARSSSNPTTKETDEVDKTCTLELSVLQQQKWRQYTGERAMLLKLIHLHCLRHVPNDDVDEETGKMNVHEIEEGREHQEEEPNRKNSLINTSKKSEGTGSSSLSPPEWSYRVSEMLFNRAEDVVVESIKRIQNFTRIEKAKSMSLHRKIARAHREQTGLQNNAATIINSRLIRSFLAKKKIHGLARSTLTKWIDYETGYPYWISPTTQHQFWTKPLVLGNGDVKHIIEAPHPHVEYKIACSDCHGTHLFKVSTWSKEILTILNLVCFCSFFSPPVLLSSFFTITLTFVHLRYRNSYTVLQ